ncbi:MAG TPA: Hpt domain-containing protein [Candidatus Binataceae bacterium]|nr:Hpt domain-containing protein [Candidatus Binataceae bacterium]
MRSLPAIDRAALERLRARATADAPEFFVEMATMFVAEIDRRRVAIADALAREDSDALARAAHSLGGSAKLFGATRLAEFCRQLQNAPHPSIADARVIVVALNVECDEVRAVIKAESSLGS